jgi:asparagine synthase (glutamine-hydrolysing)
MLGVMKHRGPDDEGIWLDPGGGAALGQRRLSIIDTSPAGHQPMLSDDGTVIITFNGEIYNFLELREDLLKQGNSFRSNSDTEVLIKGYEAWGTGVLDRLVGMFAFGLWDSRQRLLFLARDRLGEKPLYYGVSPSGFAFASDIQALRQTGWFDSSLDRDALALYLWYQYVPAPYSIYMGIRKLPPAHAMTLRDGRPRIWRYWDPLEAAAKPRLRISEEEALTVLEGLLRRSVRGQMISDVPLGAFLSGGIDSSVIVSLMSELSSQPIQTFTIGFSVPEFNEAHHAAAVAERLGTRHTVEYLTEQDAIRLIPEVPRMYGEPFADASVLPTHLVAQVARKQVTVSLSGDGGDELFGGYTRYVQLDQGYRLLRAAAPLKPVARAIAALLPDRLARAVPLIGKGPQEVYRSLMSYFGEEEVLRLCGRQPLLTEYDRAWSMGKSSSMSRKAMLADMLTYLPEDILVKVDRAAMAVSLETRAPFLDHRIVEFSLQLPSGMIKEKHLLKELAYRKLPRSLMDRPKQGFGVPLAKWFRGELRSLLTEVVSSKTLGRFGLTDCRLVERCISEHLNGQRNYASRLWALLVLGLWGEEYL